MSNGTGTSEVLRNSVTRGDTPATLTGGGVVQIITGWDDLALVPVLPIDPPKYWTPTRDRYLRLTVHAESMWSSAIYKALTKFAASGWTVRDAQDSQLRVRRAQEVLHGADNGLGWVPFASKLLRDFLTQDNGAFVEIVRASRAPGSRILGLMHLDSARCTRTGDARIPVLYRDAQGREHELRAHQVVCVADMPDSGETYHGVGLCAASRAYRTIAKLAAIERYVTEKVTGARNQAIHLVNGVTRQQVQDALKLADAEQQAQGHVLFKGAVLLPLLDPSAAPTVATIDLASLPDGFDAKQERDNAYIIYANAIGVPVQDIQPLSGQGLGTGTQSIILDEAAEGMGLAAFRKHLIHVLNTWVFPSSTTFSFDTNDVRDQKGQAEARQARADVRKTMIASGEITAQEARQIALDAGDLPRELVPQDRTAGGSVADDEKVVEVALPDASVSVIAEKSLLTDDVLAQAAALLAEVRGD